MIFKFVKLPVININTKKYQKSDSHSHFLFLNLNPSLKRLHIFKNTKKKRMKSLNFNFSRFWLVGLKQSRIAWQRVGRLTNCYYTNRRIQFRCLFLIQYGSSWPKPFSKDSKIADDQNDWTDDQAPDYWANCSNHFNFEWVQNATLTRN